MRKISLFIFMLLVIFTFQNVNAKGYDDSYEYNGVTYYYKATSYVQSQKEADELIEKYGTNIVEPYDFTPPKEFPYFVGFNNATHQAIYSDKKQPLEIMTFSTSNLNIKAVGTWKAGGYWGTVMRDTNGTYYQCADNGKNYPWGLQKFEKSEHTPTKRALSYGFPFVKSGSNTNFAQYGKTQLAYWKARGANIKVTSSTVGTTYWKVYQAYKGTIGENKKTFKINGKVTDSGKYTAIPNQNVTNDLTISGNAKFGINTSNMKKITDADANVYIYHKTNKKWVIMKANTMYSASNYSKMRFATKNMASTKSISGISIITDISDTTGYMWDNGKSGDQKIVSYENLSTFEYSTIAFRFNDQTGSAIVTKKLDGIDFYGENILDEDGNLVYNTVDGKFKYVEEDGVVTSVNYPSEAEMKANNSFSKNISYKAPVLIPSMEEKVKLDENGDPIQKVEDGNLVVDENGDPVYETELVQRKTADDQLIYEHKEVDGEKQYQDVVLDLKYFDEEGMKNIKLGANVPFNVYKSDGTFVKTVSSDAKGVLNIKELIPGNYYILEKEAPEGYKKATAKFNFKVEKNKTTTINNNVIWNYALAGELNIKKVDKDFMDRLLAGAGFELYKLEDDGTYDEENPVAYLETEEGLASTTRAPGKYVLKEIVAPNGYTVDPTEHIIEIKDNENNEIEITNEQIKEDFSFKKVAAEKLEMKLTGGKFGVYSKDENGKTELLDTFSASKTNYYTFTGTYDMNEVCFVELEAPKGRVLDKTPMCYKIDESGFYNDVTMTNELEEIILIPKAGGIDLNSLFSFNN